MKPQQPLFVFEHAKNPFRGPSEGARFSEDKRYRYVLWRMWNVHKPYVNFIMLNPSYADAVKNDPTIERQVRRVRRWGDYGGIVVTNAYAAVSTDWRALRRHPDPIGVPLNGDALAIWAKESGLVICGWGCHVDDIVKGRQADVLGLLRGLGCVPHALSVNDDRTPGHPLYLSYDVVPVPLPVAHLRPRAP